MIISTTPDDDRPEPTSDIELEAEEQGLDDSVGLGSSLERIFLGKNLLGSGIQPLAANGESMPLPDWDQQINASEIPAVRSSWEIEGRDCTVG